MGMTRQAPAAATGGLVEELKAHGQEKGEDAFDKHLPIAKELKVCGFVSKINRDGPVFAGLFGRGAHVLPLYHQVSGVEETRSYKGRFFEKWVMDFPPCGIVWGVQEPTTARREAMFCQAAFDQWRTTIMQHLSPLSKPQATVLALWSLGMVLAHSCAVSAVRHCLAKGMQRKEQTVRQQRRAWYYDTPRKRGTKRQVLHVETCFPVLLGWVVSWWQGTPRALAIEATALGARFVVLAVSVV